MKDAHRLPPLFRPPRDRDAYPAIRGYVYQIDQTVDQWLALVDGQVLELERGEDIDLVGRLLSSAAGREADRLLQQVKYRDSSITLRSPGSLEALANFCDHRASNPGLSFRFRFLSNAPIGVEQRSSFPGHVPGIVFWGELRARRLATLSPEEAAALLLNFISRLRRPSGLDEKVWTRWREYLTTATSVDFLDFVDSFEWAVGTESESRPPINLHERVRARGFAGDEAEAGRVADHLFVHVVRILCNPGLKRLTAADRNELLSSAALQSAERDSLAALRAAVNAHAEACGTSATTSTASAAVLCHAPGHAWRERVLDPVITVHLFVLQVLHGNAACAHVPHLGGVVPPREDRS